MTWLRPFLPRIRLPSQVAGDRLVGGLGGPFADVDHVGDPGLLRACRAARDPAGPAAAQRLLQQGAQLAAGLAVQRLVDRLVGHPQPLVVGMVLTQPAGDLLRRPASGQPGRDRVVQPPFGDQPPRLRPARPTPGQPDRLRRPVGRPAAAPGDLAVHHQEVPTSPAATARPDSPAASPREISSRSAPVNAVPRTRHSYR